MMYEAFGKQILHREGEAVTQIADAADNEKAHFLAYMANVSGFIPNALRTLSPAWHGELVALAQLKGRINGAIDAINKLDQLKKTLFYGRDNNLIADGQHDSADLPAAMVMPVGANPANVFHAILGKVTEAGELLEALRACYNGEVFDRINAIEEVGDGFWYDAVLLEEMVSSFPDAMITVIAKLRARFPDKFTETNANVRDLEAERAILESNGGDYAPDGYSASAGIELVPTVPASGPAAVNRVADAAAVAFEAVKNVGDPTLNPLVDPTGENHKPTAARSHPLPQEGMAQSNSGQFD